MEKVKKYLPSIVIISILFYIGNRLSKIWSISSGNDISTKSLNFITNLSNKFIGNVSFEMLDIAVGFIFVLFILIIVEIKGQNKKNFRKGVEYGSARWGKKKDIEPFLPEKYQNRILLSETEALMINEKPKHPKYERNLNVLAIGGSGAGKTRFFVKPNLMQMNSSYILTDSKGSVLPETGKMFLENGYNIKIFNTINMQESMRYNPLEYIRSESDILKFINVLIANTSNNQKQGGDSFWENTEKLLLTAFIAFMFETKQDILEDDPEAEIEEFNFAGLQKLINNSQVDENDPEQTNPVDEAFKEHEEKHGDSLAVSQYKKYRLAAGKTAKSILISVGTRLAPFDLKEVRDLTEYDELKLEDIGDQKTIFYIIVSDTDTTFNFLAGMMYSQLFDLLTNRADNNPNHKLKYPVQMYLDEFANIGTIPDFEQKIATIRSRGISAVVILQSIDQLKSKYKDSANTIIDNCDTMVFLGGKGSTLKTVSETLGKETIDMLNNNKTRGSSESYTQNNSKAGRELMTADEIGTMDNSKCIVSIRGVRPFMSNKIELTKHKNYKLLSDDSEDGKTFDYVSYIESSKEDEEVSKNTEELDLPDEFQLNLENEDGNIEMYSFDIDKALENKRSVIKLENI